MNQTHFCNEREGSDELCVQAISAALYSVVQSIMLQYFST